jgi:hypothetical protein
MLVLLAGAPAQAQDCCCEGAEMICEMPVAKATPTAQIAPAAPTMMACSVDLLGQLMVSAGSTADCPCWESRPLVALSPAQVVLLGSSEIFSVVRLEMEIDSPPAPRSQSVEVARIDRRNEPPPKLLLTSFSLFPLPPPAG